jgi:putative endonuclease
MVVPTVQSMSQWFVYMVRCSDGTYYTGVTTDLTRRVAEHNGMGGLHKGAKYTKTRRPVELVYSEPGESRSSVQKREAVVRHYSRVEKQKLITMSK